MASRVTRNFLGALASGVDAALREKMLRDEEQRKYGLDRSRALQEEKQRRSLALQYNDEDYRRDLARNEGEYKIKRSRVRQEDLESKALKDAENQRLIDMGALIGKETGDRNYALKTITKTLGLPEITDPELQELNRALKQSQIGYYNNRALNVGKTGGKSGSASANKGVLDELNQASTQMERIKRMIRDGKERNALGEETGRVLDDTEIASLNGEYKKLFRYHSALSTKLFGGEARDPQYFLDMAEGAIGGADLADAMKPQPVNPMQHVMLRPGVEALSDFSGSAMNSAGAGVPQSILFEILRQFTSPAKPLPGLNPIK
jgi:hypothetical protein